VYRGLAFAPDGNYVYYRKSANVQATEFNVYRAPVLGGTPRQVVRDVDSNLTFAPDGQRMAYIRANDPDAGKYRVLAANLDGSNETVLQIAQSTRGSDPENIAWSPDGKRLAYSFFSSGAALSFVETFDLASKKVSTLAALANDSVFELHWLSDGRSLLVVYSSRGRAVEQAQIGLLTTDGKLRPVTRDTNRYATLTLSADGRSAATVQVKTTRSLEVLPAPPTTAPAKQLSQAMDPRIAEWTPDGKLLVSDAAKLTRIDPDGQNPAVLVGDPAAGLFSPSSCGNQYLVFGWAYHAGTTINIWRSNEDGSAPKQLTSGSFDTDPICSPDGKWVYFVNRLAASRLMRVPIDGGTAEQVPGSQIPNEFGMHGGSFFTPDGKSLAFVVDLIEPQTGDAITKLAIVSIDAGAASAPRLVDLDPRFTGRFDTGRVVKLLPHAAIPTITYLIAENGHMELWAQTLDGSPGHALKQFDSEDVADFNWSPDGKTLAITRKHDTADVVLLKEAQ
jgi:eukaryotic-like serine/threonine-protein kinase